MAIKVLVVDDSPDLLEMLASAIRLETGYEVREADSGRTALRILKGWTPDVIITDLMMPDMNGLDLIADICLDDARARPQIIAISGFADLEIESRNRGADGFQLKPVEMSDLLAMIDSLVRGVSRPEDTRSAAYKRRMVASKRAARALERAAAMRPGFDRILQEVTQQLARYFDTCIAGFVVLQDSQPSLRALFDREGLAKGPALERFLRLSGDVIQSGSTLVVADLRDLPSLFAHDHQPALMRFVAAVPVHLPDRMPVGCLVMLDQRPRSFDAYDLAILERVAEAGTDVLRGMPPPIFLRESGFLVEDVWRCWLDEELAHGKEGETMHVAMIEMADPKWQPLEAAQLIAQLPARAAIAEVDPKTLLFYSAGAGSESVLERLVKQIEDRVAISAASSLVVGDLELGHKSEAVLSILGAMHSASKKRGTGSMLRSELRPSQLWLAERAPA